MITRLKINGFKSFQNFEMTFTPLTIIAGANASGKSNLFDALKLLSRLAETDLKTAFHEQRGNSSELFTQYDENWYAEEMEFVVEMLVNRNIRDNWGATDILNTTRLRYKLVIARQLNEFGIEDLVIRHESLEKIKSEEDDWAKQIIPKEAKKLWKTIRAGGSKDPFIQTSEQSGKTTIKLRQDGKQGGKATTANAVTQTVLGGINSVDFPTAYAAKEEMRSWKFLQLNPEDLREPTRQEAGLRDVITESGKNLAAALYRIRQADEYVIKQISRELGTFLPNFTDVNVYDDKANQQFIIVLKESDGKAYSSRVLSEGTLRLLALCILEYDKKHTGLLCFEEPENGIHPLNMEAMAQLLRNLSLDFTQFDNPLRQVIVNTHSPVLVGKMIRWQGDTNVTVWFSRLHTLVTQIDDRKIKLKITKMTPVRKGTTGQLSFFHISESERKLTLSDAIRYLETADSENIVKAMQND